MNFSIEWIDNNPIVTLKDHVDFEVLNSANNSIIGDSRFDDMKYQIFDHREISHFNLNSKELAMIGLLDKNSAIWNKNVKVALVITKIDIIEKVNSYIIEMTNTKWSVSIFDSFEMAQQWCLE
jgi:hypothetical protein